MTTPHLPSGNVCRECGLVHPYTAPGQCPVAKGKSIEQSTKSLNSEKAIAYMQAIQIKLLDRLKKLTPEQQEKLCKEIMFIIDK